MDLRYLGWGGFFSALVGSFLPLMKVPILGGSDYWHVNEVLAIVCWALLLASAMGMLLNNKKLISIASATLLVLFVFTIVAIKWKAGQTLHGFSGLVKLGWGWFFEFAGALLMLASATVFRRKGESGSSSTN